jgi:hypothetical protein
VSFLKKNYNFCLLYTFLILAVAMYYLFQNPIMAGDTDLWYHLNGGRYIVDHKSIPQTSFFSFISPPREWVNYYWLFQILVYEVYSFFNYYGLVIFRAFIFLIITLIILHFLFKNQENNRSKLYFTIIFSLIMLLLLPRYQLVRPHMFTYLLIVLFIYIVEFYPKKIVFLPILAIIWSNIHGIEYPVMLLICLSYIIEFFYNHIKNKTRFQKGELPFIISIVVSLGAVYVTPHGTKLMWVPFLPTGFASHYIQELKHISAYDLLSFHIVKMSLSFDTIFNLLFVATCFSFVTAILKKNIRISHFLLFAGGVILLTRGNRFTYEFVLLTLPIIKNNPLFLSPAEIHDRAKKIVNMLLVAIILIIPLVCLKNFFPNTPKYPFSQKNLPHGNAMFLKYIDVQGSVLNHPNYGGYLQWVLYPKYKIFMDMEVPFLFTNEDFYIAKNVYSNEVFLRKIITEYDPSFILVSLGNLYFKEAIKPHSDYKIVFFDDSEVLYANKKHYPDIVKTYELKVIDPFTFKNKTIDTLKKEENIAPVMKELMKMVEIYPDSGIANQYIAVIYNEKEPAYEKAIKYADAITRNYPESPVGYRLKGDSYKKLNMFDKAISYYKMALERSDLLEIHKEIGLIYFTQGKYENAYNTLIKVTNIYANDTTYKDLYYLILSAYLSNKTREAVIIFRYAYKGVPVEDREWYGKYQELRTSMGKVLKDMSPENE